MFNSLTLILTLSLTVVLTLLRHPHIRRCTVCHRSYNAVCYCDCWSLSDDYCCQTDVWTSSRWFRQRWRWPQCPVQAVLQPRLACSHQVKISVKYSYLFYCETLNRSHALNKCQVPSTGWEIKVTCTDRSWLQARSRIYKLVWLGYNMRYIVDDSFLVVLKMW